MIITDVNLFIIWLQPVDFQSIMILSPILYMFLQDPFFEKAKTNKLRQLTGMNVDEALDQYLNILGDPIVTKFVKELEHGS